MMESILVKLLATILDLRKDLLMQLTNIFPCLTDLKNNKKNVEVIFSPRFVYTLSPLHT